VRGATHLRRSSRRRSPPPPRSRYRERRTRTRRHFRGPWCRGSPPRAPSRSTRSSPSPTPPVGRLLTAAPRREPAFPRRPAAEAPCSGADQEGEGRVRRWRRPGLTNVNTKGLGKSLWALVVNVAFVRLWFGEDCGCQILT
jgi:hypothetical protein